MPEVKEYSTAERYAAGLVLGIRDKDLNMLSMDRRNKDALTVSVLLLQIRLEALLSGHNASMEKLSGHLKSALSGKRKANKRADAAELVLRNIREAMPSAEVSS